MALVRKKLNEKELKKYLSNYGVAKHLKFFASMLCDKKFNLRLTYGGGSSTDWKTVFIGIPEYLVGHTKEEVLSTGKALTAHEIEHINSTPFEAYQGFIKEFAKYFKDNHDINEAIGNKVGAYIINALEDGRIERLSCEKFPGVTKYLVFHRGLWWQNNAVNGEDELMNTLFCLCTFATMGLFPKGYAESYDEKEELYDMVRGIKKPIMKFVNSDDFDKGLAYVWDMIHQIEDWMVELMKAIPEPELSDKFDEANKDFGEVSEGYGAGSGSTSPSSSDEEDDKGKSKGKGSDEEKTDEDEESSSDVHKAFDPSNTDDSSSPAGEQKDPWEVTDIDNEEISDRSMDSIIDEAMKNFEEEIHEEEYKNVIQADYDDILENKKLEAEKAKEEGLDAEEKKELLDYYRNLDSSNRDGDWAVPLKIHRFNYDKVEAPQSIKLESKKLKKEFETIFLNKKSLNSKNRRRGMLDTNSLWKVQNKDYNIFQKKGSPNDTDYVFYILVDGSGSMHGDKFKQAYRATSLLEESLGGFVPLKIVQFDADSKVNHYIVKDFEQRKGNLSWAFVNNNEADNCNMDGYSIRVALKELAKRKEKKKVLIVLSDGQPSGWSCYYGGRAERDVKEAIREGRKQGVDIFNIMFGSEYQRKGMIDSFKFMYEKGIISCEPEHIANELLRVVKRELVK